MKFASRSLFVQGAALAVGLLTFGPGLAFSSVPQRVAVQGQLQGGALPVPQATTELEVEISRDSTFVEILHAEVFPAVPVGPTGVFSVTLGTEVALSSTLVDDASDWWVRILVEGVVVGDAVPVTSVPFALHAGTATLAERASGVVSGDVTAAPCATVDYGSLRFDSASDALHVCTATGWRAVTAPPPNTPTPCALVAEPVDEFTRLDCGGQLVAFPRLPRFRKLFSVSGDVCGVTMDEQIRCSGTVSKPVSIIGKVRDILKTGPELCVLFDTGKLSCTQAPAGADLTGNIVAVTGQSTGLCVVRETGYISCYGSLVSPQLPSPPSGTFTDVEACGTHVCALGTNGRASCWGAYEHALLNEPSTVFESISCGGELTACGLTAAGATVCWGTPMTAPPPTTPLKSMVMGNHHACGIDATGHAVCWGANIGNYSNNSFQPTAAGTFEQVIATTSSFSGSGQISPCFLLTRCYDYVSTYA